MNAVSTEQSNAVESRHANVALAISFLLTAAAGCTFIYLYWAGHNAVTAGVLRCMTYTCAMAAIHLWGYQAYRRQWAPVAQVHHEAENTLPVPLDYAPPAVPGSKQVNFAFVAAQQGIVLAFTSIILDGGYLYGLAFWTIIIYWVMVLIIRVTRKGRLTRVDIGLLQGGFWILMPVIVIFLALAWKLQEIMR